MLAVIQRVKSASVAIDSQTVSSIQDGLLVLVGISADATPADSEYIQRKILNTRLWDDGSGKTWSKSVTQRDYQVLCVSQFTLHGFLKGNKPDFHLSMPPDQAKTLYNGLVNSLKAAYNKDEKGGKGVKGGKGGGLGKNGGGKKNETTPSLTALDVQPPPPDFAALVQDGLFGADMAVTLVNDGPVTLILDSKDQGGGGGGGSGSNQKNVPAQSSVPASSAKPESVKSCRVTGQDILTDEMGARMIFYCAPQLRN